MGIITFLGLLFLYIIFGYDKRHRNGYNIFENEGPKRKISISNWRRNVGYHI